MNLRVLPVVALLSVVSFFLSGCKTFNEGADQKVAVQSYPSGAFVKINGEVVGITPTEVELARKVAHSVVLDKPGYKTKDVTVAPVRNDAGADLVKFGLMDDAGLYYDLDPNPLQVQMIPDVLPNTRGPDAYSEMTAIIADVDQKRASGEIGPVEHKYMVEKVVEFYTQ